MMLEGKVQYMSDGNPEAREVRIRGPADKRRREEGGEDRPRKKAKGEKDEFSAYAASDPYYKTQPCPYIKQGHCSVGKSCYFAHSPKELRKAPEAMMMDQFAKMMGKKAKKDKKAKSRSRSRSRGRYANSPPPDPRGP